MSTRRVRVASLCVLMAAAVLATASCAPEPSSEAQPAQSSALTDTVSAPSLIPTTDEARVRSTLERAITLHWEAMSWPENPGHAIETADQLAAKHDALSAQLPLVFAGAALDKELDAVQNEIDGANQEVFRPGLAGVRNLVIKSVEIANGHASATATFGPWVRTFQRGPKGDWSDGETSNHVEAAASLAAAPDGSRRVESLDMKYAEGSGP